MNEFVFSLIANAVKMQLITLMLKVKTNEEDITNIVKSMHAAFQPLLRLSSETKSKLDDTLVKMIAEAVEEVAKIKGIEL